MKKIKFDLVTALKIGGVLLSAAGTAASAWVNKKEADDQMNKLIDEKLKEKMGES